jgi:hypothetical protein
MVAWELQGMVVQVWVWVMQDFWASGVEREGKNNGKNFQKSPSPLSLHLQGRRSCTVPFKTAPCNFFFSFI